MLRTSMGLDMLGHMTMFRLTEVSGQCQTGRVDNGRPY